jgi:hypothetical protein
MLPPPPALSPVVRPPLTVSPSMTLPPPPTSADTGATAAALMGFGSRDARDECQQAAPKEGAHEPLENLLPRGGAVGKAFGYLIERTLLRGVRWEVMPLYLNSLHDSPVAFGPESARRRISAGDAGVAPTIPLASGRLLLDSSTSRPLDPPYFFRGAPLAGAASGGIQPSGRRASAPKKNSSICSRRMRRVSGSAGLRP